MVSNANPSKTKSLIQVLRKGEEFLSYYNLVVIIIIIMLTVGNVKIFKYFWADTSPNPSKSNNIFNQTKYQLWLIA